MTLFRRATLAALAAALLTGAALFATGCQPPPPALPKSVMDQGIQALPEEHPDMSKRKAVICRECHREVADPAPSGS